MHNNEHYFISELRCLIIQARNQQLTPPDVGAKVEVAVREAIEKIGNPNWKEFERLYESAQNNYRATRESMRKRQQRLKDQKHKEVNANVKTDKTTKRTKGA